MRAASDSNPWQRTAFWAVIVFAITVTVFSGALSAGFVAWDDDTNFYKNPHLSLASWRHVAWMFTDTQYVQYYAPLSWLSAALLKEVGGLNPFVFHLFNVVVHACNAALVFLIIVRLLADRDEAEKSEGAPRVTTFAAAAGALLWSVHPLRVEAVAWATAMSWDQALLFLCVAALAYLRAQDEPPGAHRKGLLAFSVLSYACSLFTYPIGLALPGVLIALDFFRKRRRAPDDAAGRVSWVRVFSDKAPYVLLAALFAAITLLRRAHTGMAAPSPPGLDEFGVWPRAMQACYIWCYYLWKPFVPTGLAPVYPTLVSFDPLAWPFVASALGVAGITGLLLWQRRRWPGLLIAWLCHLMIVVPCLGLTHHPHYPNDRYDQVAGVVLAVLAAAGIARWMTLRPGWAGAPALAAGLVVVLASLSARQVTVWHDSETLFIHTLQQLGRDPYRCDLHWRLGRWYRLEGRFEESVAHLRAAIAIAPDIPTLHLSLGQALVSQRKLSEAAAAYRTVLRLQPGNAKAADELRRIDALLEASGAGRPPVDSVQ